MLCSLGDLKHIFLVILRFLEQSLTDNIRKSFIGKWNYLNFLCQALLSYLTNSYIIDLVT